MADKAEQEPERLNVKLGVELRKLLDDYAAAEGKEAGRIIELAAIVRRCLLTKECLADRYKKRVDDLLRNEGLRLLTGK